MEAQDKSLIKRLVLIGLSAGPFNITAYVQASADICVRIYDKAIGHYQQVIVSFKISEAKVFDFMIGHLDIRAHLQQKLISF